MSDNQKKIPYITPLNLEACGCRIKFMPVLTPDMLNEGGIIDYEMSKLACIQKNKEYVMKWLASVFIRDLQLTDFQDAVSLVIDAYEFLGLMELADAELEVHEKIKQELMAENEKHQEIAERLEQVQNLSSGTITFVPGDNQGSNN